MNWLCIVSAFSAEVKVDAEGAANLAWMSAVERRVGEHRIARALAEQRVRPDDPEFRLRAEEVGSKIDPIQWTMRLRQNIEPIGSLRAEGRAGRAGTAAEQAEVSALQAEVVLDALERFDRVRLAALDVELAKQELALHEERLVLTEKRLEAGLLVSDDVIDAGVERMGAIRRVHEAEVGWVRAHSSLALTIGASPDDSIVVDGPDLFTFALESLESVEGPAASSDSSVSALSAPLVAQLDEATWERKAVVAAHRPFLSWVQAQVVTEPGKVARWGLSTAIELPVFSATDGQVAAADALIARRQAELDEAGGRQVGASAAARARMLAAQTGLRQVQEAETVARARMAELVDAVRPDQKLRLEADLIQERRRSLDLVEDVLVARRQLEIPSMLAQLPGSRVKVEP